MYINLHNHTDHSNYRLLDSINNVQNLLNYTQELGHAGVAITDHETVGAHVEALHLLKELRGKDPDKWNNYKLILGNEIYLCNRKKIQEEKEYNFPHFILFAKNLRGHKAIRELSTRAWCENSFTYVNLRVPTFYEDLIEVMQEYKGDIIASTACIGGTLSKLILASYDKNPTNPELSQAKMWITNMVKIFGEGNFFLEIQPSTQELQHIVNKYIILLAGELNLPYIITTDAHYLKKEDRPIHEAFLNSQDGDREVGDFYATTYVMSEQEIHQYLDDSLGVENVQKGIDNTILIYNLCEEYTLDKPLNIPYLPTNLAEPDEKLYLKYKEALPLLEYFYNSKYDSDRHLVREILEVIENNQADYCNEKAYSAIQVCLESIQLASDKQDVRWSAYLMQTKDIIQTCWDSGSLVGCSRGSGAGFVLLAMLGITQVNPLKEEITMYPWRFLNIARAATSPLDVDVDIIGELRDTIINNLQKRYGGYRHVCKVQTLMKAKSKNAIAIACRGLGYTSEEAIYLGSFIQAERGIQFSLSQTYYGDENNNILPNTEFANLMNTTYKDVWEVAQKIEGLITGTSQHAGGVIITKEDMVEDIALMKTKSGDVTTQFDLHTAESCSLIKWDILAIDALSKIKIALQLLLNDNLIEWQGDWKRTYEKYVGVYNIERNNDEIWDMIDNHQILSLFQFERSSGVQAIELGKPRNLQALAALNSVMRLMPPDPTAETPLQRYARFREDINLWYKEMTDYGLTSEEQEVVKKYALKNYGLFANQEDFMIAVQDPALGGFDLLWSDRLRKSVAKKNAKDYLQLESEYYARVKEKNLSDKLCHYVWDVLISMNRGYGFNLAHTGGYSIIALQEANLAYHYPIVYWNTACLIADSGGQDSTVRYGKIASAVGRLRKEGINIVPPYINEAEFDFKPDAESNKIVYGLKAISGIGSAEANAIVANKPYTSINDFYQKMEDYKSKSPDAKFGGTAVIQLIKAGAFDELESKPREEIMKDFISFLSKPIKKVTSVYIDELANMGMFTQEEMQKEVRYYRFKKYIFQEKNVAFKEGKSASTWYYTLDRKYAEPYFIKEFINEMEEGVNYKYDDNNLLMVKRGKLESIIDKRCEEFYANITSDPKYLTAINQAKFNELWNNKASGTIASWEMNSMFYYYHDHELAHVNQKRYGLVNFDDLPVEPEITEMRHYRDRDMPRYTLHNILGTVIDKDANHNTVTLLTPGGVVTVRFYKGQFTFYAREIVEKDKETGKKTVLEKSWFKRGTKLFITGTRMGENFVPKVYNDSIYKHSVQLINSVDEKGILTLTTDRINVDKEDADTNAISI